MKTLRSRLNVKDSFSVRDIAEPSKISTVIIYDSTPQKVKNQKKVISGNVETAISRTINYLYSIIIKRLMQGDINAMEVFPTKKTIPNNQFIFDLGKRNIYINQTVHKITCSKSYIAHLGKSNQHLY